MEEWDRVTLRERGGGGETAAAAAWRSAVVDGRAEEQKLVAAQAGCGPVRCVLPVWVSVAEISNICSAVWFVPLSSVLFVAVRCRSVPLLQRADAERSRPNRPTAAAQTARAVAMHSPQSVCTALCTSAILVDAVHGRGSAGGRAGGNGRRNGAAHSALSVMQRRGCTDSQGVELRAQGVEERTGPSHPTSVLAC